LLSVDVHGESNLGMLQLR